MKNLSKSFSIILPNYNGKKLLSENLPYIFKFYPEAETIVVDDNSSDGSAVMIKEKFPQIKLINKQKNTGFSSTVNLGAKKAKGKFLLFLNTDIRLKKGSIEKALNYFIDDKVFAVGLCDISHENGRQVRRGAGKGKFKKGFLYHQAADTEGEKTLWVSGGSGIFRKDIFEKLGGFDEIYDPFYWEDIDLSYRALKAGYKIYFAKEALVDHFHSTGSIKSNFNKRQVETISFRNQFIFVWKNISSKSYLLKHFLFLPYHLLVAGLKTKGNLDIGFFRAVGKIRKILNKRKEQSRFYCVEDAKII